MAAAILSSSVLAVTWAVTAGQQHAAEAQKRIAATMAAEELMGRIDKTEYDSVAGSWQFHSEIVPSHVGDISLLVMVSPPLEFSALDVRVEGLDVTIYAADAGGTILEMRQFIPGNPS